ncbi:MAG: hypothetical protein JSU70_18565 [Phycisphaerales bacterium]|nr:MAG: hypothetical protein JSU70_18565 [Phycisphaerales bacterium]
MIRFRCRRCGKGFSVPETRAGKKGKCPKCKSILVVPKAHAVRPDEGRSDPVKAPVDSEHLPDHLTLLDVPKIHPAEDEPPGAVESSEDNEQGEAQTVTAEIEGPPERKFPWPIDVLLYPISKPGLVTIGVIVGIPLLIEVAGELLRIGALSFPALIIFVLAFGVLGFVLKVVLYTYLYWYICECIRDSATGGLRAPETLAQAPGLWDILLSALMTFGCLFFFFLPMTLYYRHSRSIDWIFWTLTAYGALFFPMGLLAVVIFESLWGLNPILLIRSVVSTFLPYCAFVCLLLAIGYLVIKVAHVATGHPWLAFPLFLVCIHVTLVAAHLLGRFYWRYEEKLNWDL